MILICTVCGKEFKVRPSRKGAKTCSYECRGLAQQGETRTTEKNTYRQVRVDGKRQLKHRWVMEKKLGRPLRDDEEVHHKDEDKTNNHPDNLGVVSKTEHRYIHGNTKFL